MFANHLKNNFVQEGEENVNLEQVEKWCDEVLPTENVENTSRVNKKQLKREKDVKILREELLETPLVLEILKKNKKLRRSVENCIKFIDKRPKRIVNKNSGFLAEYPLTNETCNFLNIPESSNMTRAKLLTFISKYIKENNLNSLQDKKQFLLDEKLKNIFKTTDESCSWQKVQRYISNCFEKK